MLYSKPKNIEMIILLYTIYIFNTKNVKKLKETKRQTY